ncbi:MAG TPA: ferric reductase-like transmembrane domain-containing protein [Candidatus Saccharimonadales bacterium]
MKNLLNNNRFYTLAFSFLLSIFIACLLRIQVESNQLYYIQLGEAFGFLAVVYLYMTLIISPLRLMMGKPEWMNSIVFARRALGVSVAYFALAHAGVSLWGQLGGLNGLLLLPDKFVWPIIFGAIALALLVILTFTSFDKMVILLGYRRWKWIQRLVYMCGLLIILHVWAVGAHFDYGVIQAVAFVALSVLLALESWRIVTLLVNRYQWGRAVKHSFFLFLWFVGTMLLWGLVLSSRPAAAHMLVKDMANGAGTVLHITPDDDPIAGQQSLISFDIQGASITHAQPSVSLTIIDEQNNKTNVPAKLQKNTVVADYTFPKQGLYTLMLTITQEDQQAYHFTESQRVGRGIITSTSVRSVPLWAGVGTVSTAIAAIAVAAVAFHRRKAIHNYSKL